MSAYLYPELPSKKAYKEAIARGDLVVARENSPFGGDTPQQGVVPFEGPHYPKPHRYYGKATVKNGRVVKIV